MAIIKEGTTQMVMGLVSLLAMAAYLLYMDLGYGFGFMMGGWGIFEIMLIPIGGLLCLIGAALTIWGGAKSKY